MQKGPTLAVDNTGSDMPALRAADRSVMLAAEPFLAEAKNKAISDISNNVIAGILKDGCVDPEVAVQSWCEIAGIVRFCKALSVRARVEGAR